MIELPGSCLYLTEEQAKEADCVLFLSFNQWHVLKHPWWPSELLPPPRPLNIWEDKLFIQGVFNQFPGSVTYRVWGDNKVDRLQALTSEEVEDAVCILRQSSSTHYSVVKDICGGLEAVGNHYRIDHWDRPRIYEYLDKVGFSGPFFILSDCDHILACYPEPTRFTKVLTRLERLGAREHV